MSEKLKLLTANEMALLSKARKEERLKFQYDKIFQKIKDKIFKTVNDGFEDNCKTVVSLEHLSSPLDIGTISKKEFLEIVYDISKELKSLGYEVKCFEHIIEISWLKGEQSE